MREREWERERERWKARRVNPTLCIMLSPNYGTRACKKGRGARTVPSLRKNPRELWVRIIRGLSVGIITENYESEREREREREVKGAQSTPNPSPNAFPKLWDARVWKREGDAHGSLFERKILGNYPWIISGNYYWELSVGIIREYYYLVYQWRRKVEIDRDTGVSKNVNPSYQSLM